MGGINAINRLSPDLRNRVLEMLNDPGISQLRIVAAINAEAGRKVISRSSLCRFVESMEKRSGTRRGEKSPSGEASLLRIAVALEKIVHSTGNLFKK